MSSLVRNWRTRSVLALLSGLLSALLIVSAAPVAATAAAPGVTSTASSRTDDGPRVSRSSFDRRYLVRTSKYVIRDMKTINYRLRDGISVSGAFYLLSNSYGYMLNAGVPPSIVRKAKYQARLSTLSDFAELAGDEYYDNETQALARYRVIRKQTSILFNQINNAIGTNFQVPR